MGLSPIVLLSPEIHFPGATFQDTGNDFPEEEVRDTGQKPAGHNPAYGGLELSLKVLKQPTHKGEHFSKQDMYGCVHFTVWVCTFLLKGFGNILFLLGGTRSFDGFFRKEPEVSIVGDQIMNGARTQPLKHELSETCPMTPF